LNNATSQSQPQTQIKSNEVQQQNNNVNIAPSAVSANNENLNIIYQCFNDITSAKDSQRIRLDYDLLGVDVYVRKKPSNSTTCKDLYKIYNDEQFQKSYLIGIFRSEFPESFQKGRGISFDDRRDGMSLVCVNDGRLDRMIVCDSKLINTLQQGFKLFNDQQNEILKREASIALDKKKMFLSNIKQTGGFNVATQVLNYSSGLPDDGGDDTFWYFKKENRCIFYLVYGDNILLELNLNKFDSRLIKFRTNRNGTVVLNDSDPIISSSKELDHARLQRGWTHIYTNTCEGKKASF
jgi:hypothetical protein